MTVNEIGQVLSIIRPHSTLVHYTIHTDFIHIVYTDRWNGTPLLQQMDLLPDDIYVFTEYSLSDGEPLKDGDILYEYRQYMVAKGYSELWLDNPWISSSKNNRWLVNNNQIK